MVVIQRTTPACATYFALPTNDARPAVRIAMIAGLPYTALRDAVLTHPILVSSVLVRGGSAQNCRDKTNRLHN
jgi:hypothetical protein